MGEDQLAFVQHFGLHLSVGEIGKELRCLHLIWTTNDEMDHSISFRSEYSPINEAGK